MTRRRSEGRDASGAYRRDSHALLGRGHLRVGLATEDVMRLMYKLSRAVDLTVYFICR